MARYVVWLVMYPSYLISTVTERCYGADMSFGICDDAIVEFTILSTDIEASNDFLRWRIGVALMVHRNVTKGDTREMESIY